ncbi:MAG TPA: dTDP-4-dehydrorhamnose 3,5-epimerase [Candidatus Paceibacterota bacterium]|nr:dTDP-4-dehydrorhamnose 3,5-epimerase [Candidatus Paceibacterota bacterium]
MKFFKTEIDGAYRIELDVFEDERGWFARTFCIDEFKKAGIDFAVVQSNRSFTRQKGMLRGLHYQKEPMWEPKIVQCLRGKTFQVIADLRPASPTYKKWISLELTGENRTMFYSPKGCANGFQALTDDCELLYFMGERYSPEHATGVRYDDPALGIKWPIANPILSEKDKNLPTI